MDLMEEPEPRELQVSEELKVNKLIDVEKIIINLLSINRLQRR